MRYYPRWSLPATAGDSTGFCKQQVGVLFKEKVGYDLTQSVTVFLLHLRKYTVTNCVGAMASRDSHRGKKGVPPRGDSNAGMK